MTTTPITKDSATLRVAREQAATQIKACQDAKIATLSRSGDQADDEEEDTDEGEEVEADHRETGLTEREKARRRAAQWAEEERSRKANKAEKQAAAAK